MTRARLALAIAPVAPYAAVAIGLYAARSAWAAIVLYHLGMVAVLSVSGWAWPLRRAASGWRRGTAAACAAVSVLAGVALYALWPYIDATPQGLENQLARFGLGGPSWWWFAAYYSSVHPFLEELFWRGRDAGGAAALWRDAAFAGYHIPVLWLFIDPAWIGAAFVVLAGSSWTWRWAARRFAGMGIPLASHIAADASIVAAASLISRVG